MEGRAIALAIIAIILVVYLYDLATRPTNVFRDNYYFDWNATTPLLPEAARAMDRARNLGNASAAYATEAKSILAGARDEVAAWAGIDKTWDISFTSGGSESICTWLRSLRGCTLFTSAAEHKTTLLCARALADSGAITLRILPVAIDGAIDAAILRAALAEPAAGPRAVSLVAANNETGTLTDLEAVSSACRAAGAQLHIDAVQTFGKYPDIGRYCDAFSASAHKFGGPQGIGLLCTRGGSTPLIFGTQQGGSRGGTENIAAVAGLEAALRHVRANAAADNAHMAKITRSIATGLPFRTESFAKFVAASHSIGASGTDRIFDDSFNPYTGRAPGEILIVPITGSAGRAATPNTLQFSIVTPGKFFCNLKLRDALTRRKIIIGIGSACNAGKPNHVLEAIGAPRVVRTGVVRISVGPTTSSRDVAALLAALPLAIDEQLAA